MFKHQARTATHKSLLTKIVVDIVVMACDWIARIRMKKRAITVVLCYYLVCFVAIIVCAGKPKNLSLQSSVVKTSMGKTFPNLCPSQAAASWGQYVT